MAKWGEGDPRWIVEERPDATNVNNWHWTEKNATPWSKERFNHLFKNFVIGNENIVCTIEDIIKCTGEATANNRKGKLIFFYEWELILKWRGSLKLDSSSYTGQISIPNLSEENDIEEIEITITIDESNNVSEMLKQFMYKVGRESIRKLLDNYVTELKEEYSKNLILPIKNLNAVNNAKLANGNVFNTEKTKFQTSSSPSGCKLDDRSIIIEEDFKCSAKDLYNVLTTQALVEVFTRGPANIDARPAGRFDLYGGNVHGYFKDLISDKLITLKWRLKSWPAEHYSNVVIEFEEMKNSTLMKLKQSGVPAAEYDAIKANWYRYYWHSIKLSFGYGCPLANVL